jgi:hypothetical protein
LSFVCDNIEHLSPINPPYIYDCCFHKSRDSESFIILNFVVLYSNVFKLCFMSLPCSLKRNTLNSVRNKVGSGKLGWGMDNGIWSENRSGWWDSGTRYRPLYIHRFIACFTHAQFSQKKTFGAKSSGIRQSKIIGLKGLKERRLMIFWS